MAPYRALGILEDMRPSEEDHVLRVTGEPHHGDCGQHACFYLIFDIIILVVTA